MDMKDLILKLCRWLLALMGLGGAFSCGGGGLFIGRDEYGTPYSTFRIKGKVVDSESGAPVRGVTVSPCHAYSNVDENGGKVERYEPYGVGIEVDDDGVFVLSGESFVPDDTVPVLLHDDDPESDGYYRDSVYVVELKPVENAKDEGIWHVGTYAADVTLEAEQFNQTER